VPLVGPQGIWKPRQLRDVPLTITTVPEVLGRERPYDDGFTHDNHVLYRYCGTDPSRPDNRGLRRAMEHQVPLVYFHGLVPGAYAAEWPAFVVADDPSSLCFTVFIQDRKAMTGAAAVGETFESDARRAYAMRSVRARMHQQKFRQRVLGAYAERCAICSLHHEELLDAAHILPDGHPLGTPVVPNGLSLCKLHHAAFDGNIVGVSPDLVVTIRPTCLTSRTVRCSSTGSRVSMA